MGEKKKKPPRTKGDGSFYQRKDLMWIGRVELPPGLDGKRRYRTVSAVDRNLAIERFKKLRNDVQTGRIAVTGNTTVSKWLDRWLEEIHSKRIRPTTLRSYRTAIENHIKPAIGSKRLDKLTPQHVRQMHNRVGERRSAVVAHVILQKALKDAVREQMLTVNVAELVDKPKYRKQNRKSLPRGTVHAITSAAQASRDISGHARWVAAFLTGGRQGELLGLTWDRVDLDNGSMDLSWQLQTIQKVHGCGPKTENGYPCGKGGPRNSAPGWCPQAKWDLQPDFEYRECHLSLLWTRPKTSAGTRYVPIRPGLLSLLRIMYAQEGPNPHNLVWHHDDGRPIYSRDDSRDWHDLLKTAGVIGEGETLPLHVARHTAMTELRTAGVDEQTRMELFGHSSVEAQRMYAHADLRRHLAAMSALDSLLAIEP